MIYWIYDQWFGLELYSYTLALVGLTVTLNLVRFSLISALTPIAAKYSSRKILIKSLETSETNTNV